MPNKDVMDVDEITGKPIEEIDDAELMDVNGLEARIKAIKNFLPKEDFYALNAGIKKLNAYLNDSTKELEFEKLYNDFETLIETSEREVLPQLQEKEREQTLKIQKKLSLIKNTEARKMYASFLLRLNDLKKQNLSYGLEYGDHLLDVIEFEINFDKNFPFKNNLNSKELEVNRPTEEKNDDIEQSIAA